MSAFSVQPQQLVSAGAVMADTAAGSAATATALRSALSAIGAAAGHPGVGSAAEDAAARWRGAVQAWAGSADSLATALGTAGATYARVEDELVR
jgi:hypothetical protein